MPFAQVALAMEDDIPHQIKYEKKIEGNEIIRLLAICGQKKIDSVVFNSASKDLSKILIQQNGLLNFIQATCDFDSSSQIKTTFDERFRAISFIIANMPSICCDPKDFYSSLYRQVIFILTSPTKGDADKQIWKLGSYIFIALYEKKQSPGRAKLIKPIKDAILCKKSFLILTQSIICIHRLILNDFDKNQFIPVFPNILAIYTVLYETVSPIKGVAKEIVIDILKYVDQSLYILDASLYNLQSSSNLYSTGLIKYGNEEMLTVIPNSNLNDVSMNDGKFLDKMVTAILFILDELGNEFKLDFFLILIEKVHLSHLNQMVLFSLVDALQEQVSNWILDYPNKAIQFLTNTLRRITSDSNDSIQSLMNQEDEQILEKSKVLQMDSLSMLIQIVSILVESKDKLTSEELLSLKTCNVYLTKVVASELLSKSEQVKIQSLIDGINHLNETTKHSKIDNEDRFSEAVRCLNSDFMPQRAHGLVILRNLIDAQHQSTIDHKSELFTLIKACLSDPDSYVYLAAVNALASLALAHTESCLPTLVEAYHDRDRSVRERVSVGESLVWVCKYLGQLAHHYHRLVVDCFLTGLRDENESIRVSSLSNLGQFCSSLKNALSYCIIEIVCAVECLLKTDPSLDVKRACLMFLYIMLNGIENAEIILDHLKQIYHIIKSIDSKSLGDDIIRVHAHLALEARSEERRVGKECQP